MVRLGEMRFVLTDDKDIEGVDCSFTLCGQSEDDEVMSIETYHCLCRQFAAAMGFAETTINKWFGDY